MTIHPNVLTKTAATFAEQGAGLSDDFITYISSIGNIEKAFGNDKNGQELAQKFGQADKKIEWYINSLTAELTAASSGLLEMARNVDKADLTSIVSMWKALPDLPSIPKDGL